MEGLCTHVLYSGTQWYCSVCAFSGCDQVKASCFHRRRHLSAAGASVVWVETPFLRAFTPPFPVLLAVSFSPSCPPSSLTVLMPSIAVALCKVKYAHKECPRVQPSAQVGCQTSCCVCVLGTAGGILAASTSRFHLCCVLSTKTSHDWV